MSENHQVLRCDECRATAETFELGWVSFYSQVPDEDPVPVLLTYCARCARRECESVLDWLTAPAQPIATVPPDNT